MPNSKQTHKTLPPPRCSTTELKQFVYAFRQLAQKFRDAEKSGDTPWQMRRNLCLGWGVQAGILLCKCIDHRAFPFLSEGVRKPGWDLRGDELNDKQRYLLAKIALSHEKMPLALLTEDDPDPWEIAKTPEVDPSTHLARIEAADAMTKKEARQLHERWRKKVAHWEANPRKHALDKGDHMYLLTWFAAIRWDLAQEHTERLRCDLPQVFHPWVDTFKNPPPVGKAVIHTPLPAGEIEDDHVMFILRAHAEIQADTCDLLAEVLETEERILADQTNAGDAATPAVPTETIERKATVTKPSHDASAGEPSDPPLTLADIPPLNKQNGEWVLAPRAKKLTGSQTATLSNDRIASDSLRSKDKCMGIDRRGRMWRKERELNQSTWYYVPSLSYKSSQVI